MSVTISSPRYETKAALDTLDTLLGYGNDEAERSQDWQLIIADPKRLDEFCNLYESGSLNIETKFALMMLIIASLDDASYQKTSAASDTITLGRIERLLRQDFVLHLHTIHYWSMPDEADPDNVFSVTPILRRIWADCFKAEYQPWLEED